MPFVCAQPNITSWARRSEDLTFHKADEKDAVIIARLTAQLRCYVPESVDETWGRPRHLGARREQLLVEMVSQVQQMRALLECVWPATLDTAKQPFRWATWPAAMSVILQVDGGDLKAGVITHRPGALKRVALLLGDWHETQHRLADAEARMLTVLDELQLTELVTSITGLSPIGAAAILAETGDPTRFATARALVKHAGLAPPEKLSARSSAAPNLLDEEDLDYGVCGSFLARLVILHSVIRVAATATWAYDGAVPTVVRIVETDFDFWFNVAEADDNLDHDELPVLNSEGHAYYVRHRPGWQMGEPFWPDSRGFLSIDAAKAAAVADLPSAVDWV